MPVGILHNAFPTLDLQIVNSAWHMTLNAKTRMVIFFQISTDYKHTAVNLNGYATQDILLPK